MLQKYYSAELPHMVKVVKGLPTEWRVCSRRVVDMGRRVMDYIKMFQ